LLEIKNVVSVNVAQYTGLVNTKFTQTFAVCINHNSTGWSGLLIETFNRSHILGLPGFFGLANVLAPLVFNLRRQTLSAADTYNIL